MIRKKNRYSMPLIAVVFAILFYLLTGVLAQGNNHADIHCQDRAYYFPTPMRRATQTHITSFRRV